MHLVDAKSVDLLAQFTHVGTNDLLTRWGAEELSRNILRADGRADQTCSFDEGSSRGPMEMIDMTETEACSAEPNAVKLEGHVRTGVWSGTIKLSREPESKLKRREAGILQTRCAGPIP